MMGVASKRFNIIGGLVGVRKVEVLRFESRQSRILLFPPVDALWTDEHSVGSCGETDVQEAFGWREGR